MKTEAAERMRQKSRAVAAKAQGLLLQMAEKLRFLHMGQQVTIVVQTQDSRGISVLSLSQQVLMM